MTYNIAGFKHRPSYEEILQQQDDSSEQLEITAMMIQSATNESSNTTEEGLSSSEVESQLKHGRGSLVQQVARRVESYMRFSGVSDTMMPWFMDTIPPSLWFRAIRATVAHITSSDPVNHVLDFMQEDIPPATTDLNDHNALTNLWAQRILTEKELSILLESSLDIDIEPQYDALTQRLNAINGKMFDLYRVSTFLVYADNSHKHPARTLITDAFEATNTGATTIRTLIGELEKQAARKAARATRNSKGAQSEDRTQTSSTSPPKIETIPHTFSVGAWLLDATKNNTRMRKTARKTTSSNPLSQTTVDELYPKKDGNDDEETKSKRLKNDTHMVDTHAFTTSSGARDDHLAETINLINEMLAVCKKDIPGSISMIVDSGTSHILLRQEHAHVLHNVTCDDSKSYATTKCAKQGAILTAIGTGSLSSRL
jgi:hypothetical protein